MIPSSLIIYRLRFFLNFGTLNNFGFKQRNFQLEETMNVGVWMNVSTLSQKLEFQNNTRTCSPYSNRRVSIQVDSHTRCRQ